MVAKLTVVFFIVLCLLAGFVLTLFPWLSFGRVGDWGNNQILVFVSQTLNFPTLQSLISSNWIRGAVSGLGVLNLCLGFWEIANFKNSVEIVEGKSVAK